MATQQSGHDIVTATAVELVGVALFGILAGISDEFGSVIVVIMWGLLLGWLLINTQALGSMVKAL